MTVRPGSRVRLRPHAGGDVLDLALRDRLAAVESLEQDDEGRVHVTVTLDDDPGRDLSPLGHRFFFALDEIEPLAPGPTTLVAGIGNIFLGDDSFGCEVAKQLARCALPPGVDVRDFGIRGLDLAYALQEGYDTVVLVDAAPRGAPPGTVSLVEPELDVRETAPDAHGLDPVRVLGLARALGRVPPRVLLVACEPERIADDDLVGELSPSVAAAVPEAVRLVLSLLGERKAVSP